jgi:hypothetical protein
LRRERFKGWSTGYYGVVFFQVLCAVAGGEGMKTRGRGLRSANSGVCVPPHSHPPHQIDSRTLHEMACGTWDHSGMLQSLSTSLSREQTHNSEALAKYSSTPLESPFCIGNVFLGTKLWYQESHAEWRPVWSYADVLHVARMAFQGWILWNPRCFGEV